MTYALDPFSCSVDNVGFGTWIWRSREFGPHSISSRGGRVDHQSAARPQSRLAGKLVSKAPTGVVGTLLVPHRTYVTTVDVGVSHTLLS